MADEVKISRDETIAAVRSQLIKCGVSEGATFTMDEVSAFIADIGARTITITRVRTPLETKLIEALEKIADMCPTGINPTAMKIGNLARFALAAYKEADRG